MKTIIVAVLAATVVALGTGWAFIASQEPVYQAQPLPSVRIGDPGHNLVGPSWSGQPRTDSQHNERAGPEVSQVGAGRE